MGDEYGHPVVNDSPKIWDGSVYAKLQLNNTTMLTIASYRLHDYQPPMTILITAMLNALFQL